MVSGANKVFGYESFARVQAKDGEMMSGDKVMQAGRALGIEFMIDRHMHAQAISTFMRSHFNGFLFVNLFPGFIHRPEVYLEGLSKAAKDLGMVSKHVVLEFTRAEATRDFTQLKHICEYGRSRGYSISLDDVETIDGAKKLLAQIQPDFLKIDRQLVKHIAEKKTLVSDMTTLAHASRCAVIAEGVETDAEYQQLKTLGIDLFQGYFFSPPVPVEALPELAKQAK